MFTWTESLSIGHPVIDADHKKLIDIVNEFERRARDSGKERLMHDTLRALLRYGREHFAREEKIQQDCQFPGFAGHQAEHRAMLMQVEEMAQAYFITREKAIDETSMSEMCLFLERWLVNHIQRFDTTMRQWVAAPAAPDGEPR